MTILRSYLSTRQGRTVTAGLMALGIVVGGQDAKADALSSPGVPYVEEGKGYVDPAEAKFLSLSAEHEKLNALAQEISGTAIVCKYLANTSEQTIETIVAIGKDDRVPAVDRLAAMSGLARDFLDAMRLDVLGDEAKMAEYDPRSPNFVVQASQENFGGFLGDVDILPEDRHYRKHVDGNPHVDDPSELLANSRALVDEMDSMNELIGKAQIEVESCAKAVDVVLTNFEMIANAGFVYGPDMLMAESLVPEVLEAVIPVREHVEETVPF